MPGHHGGVAANASARYQTRAVLGVAVLGVLIGVLLASLAWSVLSLPRTTVVRRVEQPATVSYDDGATHWVVLVRRRSIGEPVVGFTRYELRIGQDPGGGYAHGVDFDATGAEVTRFTVEWDQRGVIVRFRSGHEVRVPAASFTGGR